MRALFTVGEGYEGPGAEVELVTHGGVAFQTQDEEGQLVRLQLGYKDAGSLLRWLRIVFPGAEANVVGVRCQVCQAIATVNLHVLGAEATGHWCDDCVPEEKRKEFEANLSRGARPHDATATLDAVSYYLRSAYGYKPEEIAEMLRRHPYTIATAAGRSMTVEAVAVDIHKKWMTASGRLVLEQAAAQAGNPLAGEPPR